MGAYRLLTNSREAPPIGLASQTTDAYFKRYISPPAAPVALGPSLGTMLPRGRAACKTASDERKVRVESNKCQAGCSPRSANRPMRRRTGLIPTWAAQPRGWCAGRGPQRAWRTCGNYVEERCSVANRAREHPIGEAASPQPSCDEVVVHTGTNPASRNRAQQLSKMRTDALAHKRHGADAVRTSERTEEIGCWPATVCQLSTHITPMRRRRDRSLRLS
jgi:hypothetical protein